MVKLDNVKVFFLFDFDNYIRYNEIQECVLKDFHELNRD